MNNSYSVLMSVYYKEQAEYLRTAMNSIWMQTIPTDDFVLVCDGSLTPELDDVIDEMEERYTDILQVIRLEQNVGLGNALNAGIKKCKNELVARMDSDDISRLDRCEKQLAVFCQHPEVSICSGTIVEFIDSPHNVIGKRELPLNDKEIKAFSRKRNPCNHPAVMFRKSSVETAGGYMEEFHLFEDYYLWVRMFMKGAIAMNLKDPILYMRTPADLYMRRGGRNYAKDMLSFHWWMKSQGWISDFTFLTCAIPHAIVCILPNSFRAAVYRMLHAKEN